MSPPPHAFVPVSPPVPVRNPVRAAVSSTTTLPSALPLLSAPVPISVSRPLPHPCSHPAATTPHSNPPAVPSKPSRVLYLFQTDLRLHDNPALTSAISAASAPGGTLVPVFLNPTRHTRPLLSDLSSALAALNSHLHCPPVTTDPLSTLLDLCHRLRLSAVYMNRVSLPSAIPAQLRLAKALTDNGLSVNMHWGNVLLPPTSAQLAASPKHPLTLSAMRHTLVSQKSQLLSSHPTPKSLPAPPPVVSLLPHTPLQSARPAGTSAALSILSSIQPKEETLSAPSPASSLYIRLKPHLDYGSVSPRMVAAHLAPALGSLRGRTFSELVWRTYLSFASHASLGVRSPNPAVVA